MSDRYEEVLIYDADGEVVGDYVERVPDFGDSGEEPPDDYYDDDDTERADAERDAREYSQGWDVADEAAFYSAEPPF